VEAVRRREDPWGRLAWQVQLATFLTLVGLMSFLVLLGHRTFRHRPATADVEVAELPPPHAAPAPAAPTPPAPPMPSPCEWPG
jgi:hypothetical protein